MERFLLTARKGKSTTHLVLDMTENYPGSPAVRKCLAWKVVYAGAGVNEDKVRTVLQVMERRGIFFNADRGACHLPKDFDGSVREFVNWMFDHDNRLGEIVIEQSEAMRLALTFMLSGRCSTVAKRNRVVDGMVNLEAEAVMYWFTGCFFGYRQKAFRAALFALLNTKG